MELTLKAARINKGLTQIEVARLLRISPATLSNYENGKAYPDVPIIKKMEKLYDVEYKDLIFLL